MVPSVSIVGKSNCGKTTLIERLIPVFKEKGYRVGVIKHDAHRFDIDHEGKDSWKMARAGADAVAISSEDKLAMIRRTDGETDLQRLIGWLFDDVDMVITEGYKSYNMPKIEVVRFDLPVTLPQNNLIGLVNNMCREPDLDLKKYGAIPLFNFKEHHIIARFIEENLLR